MLEPQRPIPEHTAGELLTYRAGLERTIPAITDPALRSTLKGYLTEVRDEQERRRAAAAASRAQLRALRELREDHYDPENRRP